MTQHADSLANVYTRLGDMGRDKSTGGTWLLERPLSAYQTDAIYQGGLAARIVDRPAADMTREGWRISGVEGLDGLESAYQDLGLRSRLADWLRWGAKDGGSVIIAAVDDGGRPAEPLDMNRIQRVRGFIVLDRHCLSPIGDSLRPEGYALNAEDVVDLEDLVVHPSRVWRHDGLPLPQRQRKRRDGWGGSVFERVQQQLRAYMHAHGYVESLLHEAVIDVWHLDGMLEALASGQDELILKRILTAKMGQDILHGTVLDGKDKYTPVTKGAAGYPELAGVLISALVAATDMPRSILLGETPGGLNSGENGGETRAWYDHCASGQNNDLTPAVTWATNIILAAKDGPTGGRVPDEYEVEWTPLWQPSEKEQAEVRAINAQADVAYYQAGILDATEIRRARFVDLSTGPIEVEDEELPDEAEGAEDLVVEAMPLEIEEPEGGESPQ